MSSAVNIACENWSIFFDIRELRLNTKEGTNHRKLRNKEILDVLKEHGASKIDSTHNYTLLRYLIQFPQYIQFINTKIIDIIFDNVEYYKPTWFVFEESISKDRYLKIRYLYNIIEDLNIYGYKKIKNDGITHDNDKVIRKYILFYYRLITHPGFQLFLKMPLCRLVCSTEAYSCNGSSYQENRHLIFSNWLEYLKLSVLKRKYSPLIKITTDRIVYIMVHNQMAKTSTFVELVFRKLNKSEK